MLYEQIESNKRKTIYIVLGFIFLTLATGAASSYYLIGSFYIGIYLTGIFALFYIPYSVYSAKKIVLKMNHAKKINSNRENPHLWNTVENLSLVANIPMPELYIIEEDSPNAFAAGLTPNNACIAVTSSLLSKLNREEIEAVIAHEIAHIRNYDVRLSTISLALVAVIAIISDFSSRFLLRDSDNKNPALMIIALVLLLLAPLIAYIMHFSISRNREYLADATGAELCRNPKALATALHKISNDSDPVDNIPLSAAGMYFSEPFKVRKKAKFAFRSLLSTHPPAEERIERLLKM